MAGILRYGAYIPHFRLPRSEIGDAWASRGSRGEKAVANYDEDSLTLAVEAARDCLHGWDRSEIDGLFFVSTTSPYREKQGAGLVASVLGLRSDILTADFAHCLRAGTTALELAKAYTETGRAASILVTFADTRTAHPGSPQEPWLGDGAAAFLIGKGRSGAEWDSFVSVSNEMMDTWRTQEDDFVRSWEDRWVKGHGFLDTTKTAVDRALARVGPLGTRAGSSCPVCPGFKESPAARERTRPRRADTNHGSPPGHRRGCRGSPCSADARPRPGRGSSRRGRPGGRVRRRGGRPAREDNGTREPIARPERRDGAPGKQAETRQLRPVSLVSPARGGPPASGPARGILRHGPLAGAEFDPPAERVPLQGLRGGGLSHTENLQWMHGQGRVRGDRPFRVPGKLFTYTLDYLAGQADPPLIQSVVDLEPGCRLYTSMTDADPADVGLEMEVEMTFRRIRKAEGFYNYFWKCRPVR